MNVILVYFNYSNDDAGYTDDYLIAVASDHDKALQKAKEHTEFLDKQHGNAGYPRLGYAFYTQPIDGPMETNAYLFTNMALEERGEFGFRE